MSGAGVAAWTIDAVVASALLIAAVLLVRVPVRRAFGPGVAYALWTLPALRLVLPPLPLAWREAAVTPMTRAGETLTVLVIEPARHAVAAPERAAWLSLPLLLAVAWAAGAALFLGFHLVRHRQFCARVLRRGEVIEHVGGVAVVSSDAAAGPLAFGVWRRYVAFPRDFMERFDAEERALALAHELGHHQRGDLVANWIALAVLAVHWFDPLAWYAFRAFRADQELANDARVLAARAPALRHAYGRAIVKAACGGAVSPACHLHPITDLKGRLKMLARSPASRRRLVSGATTVAALVVAGLGLTASGSGAAAIAATVKNDVDVVQASPAPPVTTATTKTQHVVVVHDGKTSTYDGAEAGRYIAQHPVPVPPVPPIPAAPAVVYAVPAVADGEQPRSIRITAPEVRSERCDGDDRQPFRRETSGGRDRVIICTNHIAAMTRNAQVVALNGEAIERSARLSARTSLGVARAAIERDRNLSEAQRREALAGIATAETELSSAED